VFLYFTGYELTGLSRGGQQVSKCQEVYGKAVKLLVELASLQVSSGIFARLSSIPVVSTEV
jgi:hypothetical protein